MSNVCLSKVCESSFDKECLQKNFLSNSICSLLVFLILTLKKHLKYFFVGAKQFLGEKMTWRQNVVITVVVLVRTVFKWQAVMSLPYFYSFFLCFCLDFKDFFEWHVVILFYRASYFEISLLTFQDFVGKYLPSFEDYCKT